MLSLSLSLCSHVYTPADASSPPLTRADALARYEVDLPVNVSLLVLVAFTAACRLGGLCVLHYKMRKVICSGLGLGLRLGLELGLELGLGLA